MKYEIRFKNGDAVIDFGQSDISGKYKQSPNEEYYMVCDTLYTPSTSSEYIFVFTKETVLYKKAIPGDERAEWFMVFDDGGSMVVTEDYILALDCNGKQLAKKKLPGFDTCDLVGRILYVVGDNDNGNRFLLLFDVDNKTSVQKVIPDIEYEDEENEEKETQYSSDAEMLFTGEKFVFVYENETDAVAFDLHGNMVDPTALEVETANINRRKKEQEHRINRAQNSYEYWLSRLEKKLKAVDANTEEIERAKAEVQKYKNRLAELGVEVIAPPVSSAPPAPPTPAEENKPPAQPTPPAPQSPKKKGFFAKLFGK